MAGFISRRTVRIIKMVLISPILDKILIITFIFLVSFYLVDSFNVTKGFGRADVNDYVQKVFEIPKTMKINDFSQYQSWVDETLVPNMWPDSASNFTPVGVARIRQVRRKWYGSCSDLIAKCKLGKCKDPQMEFPDKCGNLNRRATNDLPKPEGYQCFQKNCTELQEKSDLSENFQGYFGNYPRSGYHIDIDISYKSGNRHKLKNIANWLDLPTTEAIITDWNVYFWPIQEFISMRVVTENISTGVFENHFKISFLNPKNLSDPFQAFLLVTIMINMSMFVLKTTFEVCVRRDFLKVAELFFHAILLAALSMDVVLFTFIKPYLNPTDPDLATEFADMQKWRYYSEVIKIFLGLSCFYYPFRVLSLFGLCKIMAPATLLPRIFYRTLPTVVLFFLLYALMIVCWAFGFFAVFEHQYYLYRSVDSSIASLLYWSFSRAEHPVFDEEEKRMFTRETIPTDLFQSMLTLTNIVFLGLLVGTLTEAVSKATAREYPILTKQEEELKEQLVELSTKWKVDTDTIVQTIDKEGEGMTKGDERQMVLWFEWFDHQSMDRRMLSREDVTDQAKTNYSVRNQAKNRAAVNEFRSFYEMRRFMVHLFKLEPQSLSSTAGNWLRIVVHHVSVSPLQELEELEEFVSFLIEHSSTTPIMLLSTQVLKGNIYFTLRPRYAHFYMTSAFRDAKNFATMQPLKMGGTDFPGEEEYEYYESSDEERQSRRFNVGGNACDI